MSELVEAVRLMIIKASQEEKSEDALRVSQAALNAANAIDRIASYCEAKSE